MEIESLKRVITDQKAELEGRLKGKDILLRKYTTYVQQFLLHPNILAIIGVRRCGKSLFSYFLGKQQQEPMGYINFDDERLVAVKTEDLDKVLQAFYELYGNVTFVILDEIQNVQGWELFANRLRRTKKVIITGSNSKLLSGELATHLTGRYIDFTLFPFSFQELLDFHPNLYLTEDRAKLNQKLSSYTAGSGFPEFRQFGSTMVVSILSDIISKDCIRRYDIRNETTFRELAQYLVSNFAAEMTYSKLGKVFGIKDVHTVKNYVNYLREAFVIIILERYSPKLKQQFIAPKKVYAIDQGFCNFVAFSVSPNKGKIIENIVAVELLRRKSVHPEMNIYYWKNVRQQEVDFVVKEGPTVKQLIQVCFDINNEETKQREVESLVAASIELKCRDLLLITREYEATEKVAGKKIIFIPLWKWLLEGVK